MSSSVCLPAPVLLLGHKHDSAGRQEPLGRPVLLACPLSGHSHTATHGPCERVVAWARLNDAEHAAHLLTRRVRHARHTAGAYHTRAHRSKRWRSSSRAMKAECGSASPSSSPSTSGARRILLPVFQGQRRQQHLLPLLLQSA